MKVYYNTASNKWYQTEWQPAVTLGGEKTRIAWQKETENHSLTLELKRKGQHAGPLIGILTGRKADGRFAGNSPLFVKLQKKLASSGGFSFIFTPEDVGGKCIEGYAFVPGTRSWQKIKVPYPDLVYNRVPFRKIEQEEPFCSLVSALHEKKIPLFNPCFLDKYELYCLFQKNPQLQKLLPATAPVNKMQKLEEFLKKYSRVYLKPSQAAKGKGIFRLSLETGGQIFLQGLDWQKIFPSLNTFWENWKAILLEQPYIVQEEITSVQYQGKRYDFRILAHAKKAGYSVTGIGVRQAQKQDLTTHIPNGGRLLEYELVRTQEYDELINTVVDFIGRDLSAAFGYFGEFSIDAGIGRNGNFYIYEVNSKPMSFDEKNIEEQKITELCRLFHELSGF